MSRVVVLDSGALGRITNPAATSDNDLCNRWLESFLADGTVVVVPEVADYELRRECLLVGMAASIR